MKAALIDSPLQSHPTLWQLRNDGRVVLARIRTTTNERPLCALPFRAYLWAVSLSLPIYGVIGWLLWG